MIISRSHAKRLVRQGKATEIGVTSSDTKRYVILNRHDLQRVDHYLALDRDEVNDVGEKNEPSTNTLDDAKESVA